MLEKRIGFVVPPSGGAAVTGMVLFEFVPRKRGTTSLSLFSDLIMYQSPTHWLWIPMPGLFFLLYNDVFSRRDRLLEALQSDLPKRLAPYAQDGFVFLYRQENLTVLRYDAALFYNGGAS